MLLVASPREDHRLATPREVDDRRGRGDSGDTQPYAVEREIEDLDALINDAGGSAYVFGNSSGAVLALVSKDATAIGYVPLADIGPSSGVKIVARIDEGKVIGP